MILATILLIGSVVLTIVTYLVATGSDSENVEIARVPRWLYLISTTMTITSFGYFIGNVLVIYPIMMATVFMIPGLAVSLERLILVRDNEVQVIQNVNYTQKARNGSSLRLFCRSGLIPLLHGEVLREVLREETKKVVFSVANMETKNSTPVDIQIVFWIRPDFNLIQNMLMIDQNQAVWWTRVTEIAQSAITARASDLIRTTKQSDAVTNKKQMSQKLTEHRISGNYLFKQEKQMGFKIDDINFIDIDLTTEARSAYEQITMSEAYGTAAKKMAAAVGIKINKIEDPDEQNKVAQYYLSRTLASAGKIKINELELKKSGGGEISSGEAMLAAQYKE